jgi:hypothetical protein
MKSRLRMWINSGWTTGSIYQNSTARTAVPADRSAEVSSRVQSLRFCPTEIIQVPSFAVSFAPIASRALAGQLGGHLGQKRAFMGNPKIRRCNEISVGRRSGSDRVSGVVPLSLCFLCISRAEFETLGSFKRCLNVSPRIGSCREPELARGRGGAVLAPRRGETKRALLAARCVSVRRSEIPARLCAF